MLVWCDLIGCLKSEQILDWMWCVLAHWSRFLPSGVFSLLTLWNFGWNSQIRGFCFGDLQITKNADAFEITWLNYAVGIHFNDNDFMGNNLSQIESTTFNVLLWLMQKTKNFYGRFTYRLVSDMKLNWKWLESS